jgi:hypothetical protein
MRQVIRHNVAHGMIIGAVCLVLALNRVIAQTTVPVEKSELHSDSLVQLSVDSGRIHIRWPIDNEGEFGDLVLRLDGQQPLIESIAISGNAEQALLMRDVDPTFFLTVGSRQGIKTDGWVVFFDHVDRRPYTTHQAKLVPRQIRMRSSRTRAVVEIDELTAGQFRGRLEFHVFAGSPLIKIEAVMKTSQDRRAILYDAGLVAEASKWKQIAWRDVEGELRILTSQTIPSQPPLAVKNRTVVAVQGINGSVAVFPSPHQFFFPLDNSTNLKFNWAGSGFHGEARFGIGIRQHPEGDRRFVPWFNAPKGTEQRMGMFLLISRFGASGTLDRVLRYTRGDRFKALDGFQTFTSHYHVAHTMDVMKRKSAGQNIDNVPDFVSVFRNMGVNVVHLAEFHGDGNPRDPGPKRLPQLELMHRECERLSNDQFLLLPGEEPNVHLGGHWMSFFPHEVYWMMGRNKDEPFVEEHPRYGRVYRVGNAVEMHRLLEREQGLAWTAHARIKGSHGYPDKHKRELFFLSDRFLGAAWKAMPADLSRPKTGLRVLDLLDDMANWAVSSDSQQSVKYVLGEVDVFKIDHTHELYGHVNVNYLQLDELPKFQDGWQTILEALRSGRFFVTTGEVLIPEFKVEGKCSGDILKVAPGKLSSAIVKIEGTFPLSFVEVISGDGQRVYRQRIDLSDSPEFDERTLRISLNLADRRWVRLEVWDIATNGAFTQPIWLQ